MLLTVADLLTAREQHAPDRVAVIDRAEKITYGVLANRARCLATAVTDLVDTTTTQRVAILLPRGADALTAYFGTHLAGAAAVIVSEQLRPRQVAHIINHADVAAVLTGARQRGLLRDVELPERQIIEVAGIQTPPLDTPVRRIGRDLAALAYTSGSTGSPKGVMLSHDNLIAGATIVAAYLGLTEDDRTLAVLPWSFDYGLNQVLATFAAGGTVVPQRSPLPGDICRSLSTHEITGLAGVPSLWTALTGPSSPLLAGNYPALRYLTNSGGTLPESIIAEIRRALPNVDLYLMYGLTEAFRSTYLPPEQIDQRPTSIGKPIPNTEILLVDHLGRPCPPGVVGEIVHRGPTVAMGYWRDPEATSTVFRPHPWQPSGGERVVYSGDYARADAHGYLYYVGRRDEIFKSRGVRVTAGEIETEILACGFVRQAVLVVTDANSPDPTLTAVVVPGVGFSQAALEAFIRDELPAHMRPRRATVVDTIPLTPHGKPDRAGLYARLTADQPGAGAGP